MPWRTRCDPGPCHVPRLRRFPAKSRRGQGEERLRAGAPACSRRACEAPAHPPALGPEPRGARVCARFPAGVNAMLRKVAVAAASKPHVEIRQDGDQFYIKTSTTVRTTEINFKVGEGFEEETVDGRKCRVSPARPAPHPHAARPGRVWARAVCREVCPREVPGAREKALPPPSLRPPSLRRPRSRLPRCSPPRPRSRRGFCGAGRGGSRRWHSRHVSWRRWGGSSGVPHRPPHPCSPKPWGRSGSRCQQSGAPAPTPAPLPPGS